MNGNAYVATHPYISGLTRIDVTLNDVHRHLGELRTGLPGEFNVVKTWRVYDVGGAAAAVREHLSQDLKDRRYPYFTLDANDAVQRVEMLLSARGHLVQPQANALDTPRQRILNQLQGLTEVFSIDTLAATLGADRSEAAKLCKEWQAEGYIEAVGPRVGLFYNRLLYPYQAINTAVDRVVRDIYVAIGANALREAGWTTQISHRFEIAVAAPPSKTFPEINRVSLYNRPRAIMEAIWPYCERGLSDFPIAPPEFALVDTIWSRLHTPPGIHHHVWHVDPDDIDPMDDDHEVIRRCYDAARIMGVDLPTVRDFLAKVPALAPVIDEVGLDETHQVVPRP